jgi:hypothetical protein
MKVYVVIVSDKVYGVYVDRKNAARVVDYLTDTGEVADMLEETLVGAKGWV